MTSSDDATKHDMDKLPMDLISVPAMRGLAEVLRHGAEKYDKHNWAKGMDWSRMYGACLRHITAWANGEDKDPESGLSHVDHALCCLMFLTTYVKCGLGTDDRHPIPAKEKSVYTESDMQEVYAKAVDYGQHNYNLGTGVYAIDGINFKESD